MAIPFELVQQTVERYQNREEIREANVSKIEAGRLFEADSPKRVQQRLNRLSKDPLVSTVITEARTQQANFTESVVLSQEDFNRIVQEQVIGQNDLMGLAYLEFALQVSRSIGRVVIRNSRLRVTGYGTGFMVSPQLLLTNNHVLPSPDYARFSLIEFNYQSSITGQILQPHTFELDSDTLFLTDKSLDFTLVSVRENASGAPLKTFGWNRLIEEQGKVILGEYVNIIQHPEGKPKQIALRENRVVDLFDNFLHYVTDTAYGSSGSPVFNDQWEVVGLHHSGVPSKDKSGNILTIDGQVWTRGTGEDRIAWKANEGIRISKVVQYIKQQSLSFDQRRLREAMFDEQPTLPITSTTQESENMSQYQSEPEIGSDGSVTWTIPLQVSIRLGGIPVTPSPSSIHSDVTPSKPGQGNNQVKLDFTQDPEIAKDLELLERARNGEIPYYDADADAEDREQYYGSLLDDANDLSRKELFKRLKELLQSSHTTQLTYNPKSRVYPWVDLQPDFMIRSIYSQLIFEPTEIIQEDFEIEKERQSRIQELAPSGSDTAKLLETLDFLESDLPYNCEHVVPQSWFNKREPMKGDLHHLFSCEVECNSFRGNTPFFDFDNFGEALRTNCGMLERKNLKFEPEHGKGEVARATLYFLVRYPGLINESSSEYTEDRLDILLRWHERFPVTEHEKHRNAAIFKKQGNRNPFIDFPEWAAKVDLSLGLG